MEKIFIDGKHVISVNATMTDCVAYEENLELSDAEVEERIFGDFLGINNSLRVVDTEYGPALDVSADGLDAVLYLVNGCHYAADGVSVFVFKDGKEMSEVEIVEGARRFDDKIYGSFGEVSWRMDDLRQALRKNGIQETDKNVHKLHDAVTSHFFTDQMIERGLEIIDSLISLIMDNDDWE